MKKGQFLLCTKDLYMVDENLTSLVFCNNAKYPILRVEVEGHRIVLQDNDEEEHTVTDGNEIDNGWLQYFKEVES